MSDKIDSILADNARHGWNVNRPYKKGSTLNPWFGRLKQATYNTTFMYNVRMLIAFTGTAFVPYLLNFQLATIPLTLGVVAAGISDIDDRFSVRIMNLIYTYIGFFITAASVQLLFPYPAVFAIGLIVSYIRKKKKKNKSRYTPA